MGAVSPGWEQREAGKGQEPRERSSCDFPKHRSLTAGSKDTPYLCAEGRFLGQVPGPPSPASFPHRTGRKASGVSAGLTTSEWGEGEGQGSSLCMPPPHSGDATAVGCWGVGDQLLLPREKLRTPGHRTLKSAPFAANPWGRAALPRLGPSPETGRGASPLGTAWVSGRISALAVDPPGGGRRMANVYSLLTPGVLWVTRWEKAPRTCSVLNGGPGDTCTS